MVGLKTQFVIETSLGGGFTPNAFSFTPTSPDYAGTERTTTYDEVGTNGAAASIGIPVGNTGLRLTLGAALSGSLYKANFLEGSTSSTDDINRFFGGRGYEGNVGVQYQLPAGFSVAGRVGYRWLDAVGADQDAQSVFSLGSTDDSTSIDYGAHGPLNLLHDTVYTQGVLASSVTFAWDPVAAFSAKSAFHPFIGARVFMNNGLGDALASGGSGATSGFVDLQDLNTTDPFHIGVFGVGAQGVLGVAIDLGGKPKDDKPAGGGATMPK